MNQSSRYLKGFFFGALICLGLSFLVSVAVYKTRFSHPDYYIVPYQMEKLERAAQFDTVFLGDSSLGNAIDAEYFNKISGMHSLNLALMGRYGYEGSFNLLRKAWLKEPHLKNVILVQTVDMPQRPPSYEGYFYTADWKNWRESLANLNFREKTELAKEVLLLFFNFSSYRTLITHARLALTENPANYIDLDYVRQGPKIKVGETKAEILKPEINTANVDYLKKIVRFCRERNLNLLYAHGPLFTEIKALSGDYVRLANQALTATGIHLIPQILDIKAEEVGDKLSDHIATPFKKKFTEEYFEILRPHLAAADTSTQLNQ